MADTEDVLAVNEAADETRKDYSQADREKMAKNGQALPDGSFPIADEQDLKNAIQAYGRAGDKGKAKAHIIKRAKALGLTNLLPDGWSSDGRAKPTDEDATIATGLKKAKQAVAAVKAEQLTDPDNDTDPDDKKVLAAINAADEALDEAIAAQSKDGRSSETVEIEPRETDPVSDLEFRRQKAATLRGVIEHREFTTPMECRTLDDGTIRMSGYASITETPYEVGPFTETIQRGAFKRTLSEQPDTSLLINHDGVPLARTTNGSLVLHEDARGLHWTADLDPSDADSVSLARKVASGLLDQCSFAFLCTDDKWDDEMRNRTVTSLSLHRGDVSVVTHGANPATSVGLRSAVAAMEARSGKSISAKNRQELEDAKAAIDRLLAADDKPEEPTVTDEAADAVDGQAVEPGADVGELVAPRSVIPDYTARARERLAQIRRAA